MAIKMYNGVMGLKDKSPRGLVMYLKVLRQIY